MYSENDIVRLLAAAENFNLQIPAGIFDQSPDKLCKICNGVGCEHPEHIPPTLRKALNRVYAFAECSAMLHDWAYFNSGGTEWSDGAAKQYAYGESYLAKIPDSAFAQIAAMLMPAPELDETPTGETQTPAGDKTE